MSSRPKRKGNSLKQQSSAESDQEVSLPMMLFLGLTAVSACIIIWQLISIISAYLFYTSDPLTAISVEKYNHVIQYAHSLNQQYQLSPSHPGVAQSLQYQQHSQQQRQLILGIAHDLDPKNLAVFCSSLHQVLEGYDDPVDIILFVNTPISHRNREIFTKYHITTVEYNPQVTIAEKYRKYHPSSLRWILFYDYLSANNKYLKYSKVLMMDVRDSYFQKNPFTHSTPSSSSSIANNDHPDSFFHVYEGVDTITISECGWNGGWVRDCFGQDVLSSIGSNHIICSGVSFGTMDNVIKYLELMHDIIADDMSDATKEFIEPLHPQFPTCERNGVDQGVHNTIVHKKLVPSMKIITQTTSTVLNLQAKKATYDPKTHIVKNALGEAASIVHQYDRLPELQEYLFQTYVDWIDTSNADAVWQEDGVCKAFTKEQDKDLFKGICDYKMQGGASTVTTCCKICEEYKDSCLAFTFYSGVCYLKNCKNSPSNQVYSLPGAISAYRKS